MSDDYISRQAAIDIVVFECGKWTGLAKEISKQLKQLPAADVAPVVHAYWRDTGSGQVCSACKEIQYGYDTGRHYCANCGAKMDGKREE